jgi:hypothetical protein
MRKILSVCTLPLAFSAMALGASWSGKLIDADCYAKQQKTTGCEATSTTTAFALDSSGKVYKLDASGNQKAATAVKNRADRSTGSTSKMASKEITAKVEGTESGDTITATSVDVQ